MTANRRIFLNIVATYGRSLLSLVCGLFSGRWLLMSLGTIDYGLLGVVGGLAVLVTFVNGLLSSAVGRFYAVAVGAAKKDGAEEYGLEECRKWFSTAVFVHTIIPTVMVVLGYPIGVWAVRHYLTIPLDRIEACVWVWRFSCILCYANMISIPFSAMYGAKQEIAELTVYSVAQSLASFCVIWYMVYHPSDWLAKYCGFNCLVCVMPRILICLRARHVYPECQLRWKYMWDAYRLKQIVMFAGCKLWDSVSNILSGQFIAILVNKMLGPVRNAAMSVGSTIQGHSSALAGALCSAFWPAVANAYGEGKHELMCDLALRACKFGAMLCLIIVLPLALEIDEVLRLWLKNPPENSSLICICLLVVSLLLKLTDGHWMVVFATGRIGRATFAAGFGGLVAILVAWGLLGYGMGIVGVGIALIVARIYASGWWIYYASRVGGLSFVRWVREVSVPVFLSMLASALAGLAVTWILVPSFARVCLTTIVCEVVLIPLSYGCVLTVEERQYVAVRFQNVKQRFGLIGRG